MAEDISSLARLSITLTMLATLLLVTISLAVTGTQVLGGYTERFVAAMNNAKITALLSLNQVQDVGGAVAYRFLEEQLSNIASLEIVYLDGTITDDHKSLLKNAEKRISIYTEVSATGSCRILAKEVRG